MPGTNDRGCEIVRGFGPRTDPPVSAPRHEGTQFISEVGVPSNTRRHTLGSRFPETYCFSLFSFNKNPSDGLASLFRLVSVPGKRIIKGRPFGVSFDRSHHHLQQGAPS
jgi:hypothetical protein